MAQRKEYRSAARSRRLIRQAFLDLLKERPFEKITITDIVNRADLNRSTFYAHYPDINGVIAEIEDELVSRNIALIEQIQYRNIFRDPTPYLDGISVILEENIDLLTHLERTERLHSRLDRFYQLMVNDILNHNGIPEHIRKSKEFTVRTHFFIGGIINTYLQWAQGNLDCSPKEISGEVAELIKKSSEDFLHLQW